MRNGTAINVDRAFVVPVHEKPISITNVKISQTNTLAVRKEPNQVTNFFKSLK